MEQLPIFTVPLDPDVRPLAALHRRSDAHVAFTRHDARGHFEPLFSVPAKDLEEVFPQFIMHHVGSNAYYSVNGFHLTERQKKSKSGIEPRFPIAVRSGERVRTLTACYVDIDCYTQGISFGQALGAFIDAQDRGIVPPATMIQRSGRGLWALWFLRSERADAGWSDQWPVRAWPEAVGTYSRCQIAIGRKLQDLGADANARDVSRVIRVPGSINTKSGDRVGYWFQLRESDRTPFLYRLDELATLLNVRPTRTPPEIRRNVTPEARERGRKGWAKLWANRLERINCLINYRDSTREGCRNSTALVLASIMRRTGASKIEIERACEWFGREKCSPPLEDHEIKAAARSGPRYCKWTDYTIGEKLRVTAEEARVTGLKPAGARPIDEPESWTRSDKRIRRHELIKHLIERKGGEVPTVRDIAEFVAEQIGDSPSLATIHRDLRAIGVRVDEVDTTGPTP